MSENKVTADNLNNVMEFYHVIRVNADGTVTDRLEGTPYFDEAARSVLVDPEAWQWEDEINLPDGWSLMNGYSGQHGYSGPVMHVSEFIGGRMARDILETPGDYVALPVESDCGYTQEHCDEESGCDCEPAGWVVATKPAE
jgi:hypothetical protein